jgi:hypothetical protein
VEAVVGSRRRKVKRYGVEEKILAGLGGGGGSPARIFSTRQRGLQARGTAVD